MTSWWYFNADYRIFEFDDEGKDGAVVPLRMDQSTLEGGWGGRGRRGLRWDMNFRMVLRRMKRKRVD